MRKIVLLLTMLLTFCIAAFSQTRTVSGVVMDESQKPLPFTTISVKGTNQAVSADADGKFSIRAAEGATLVISATGYTAKEITVDGNSVSVSLSANEKVIDEVVVTALGIKRSEKAVGYAITKVNPDNLLQKSEPDLIKSLQGKTAGVDVRLGQGTPGAASKITIRGNSSFYGDNQPLIIVDGVPYSNDQVNTNSSSISGGSGAYGSGLSDLDPNDIATLNILKGSSAGALYGSRASNGVIIITTKSGSSSRSQKGTQVSFRSSMSMETIANLPDYQNKYGTGSQGAAGGGSNGSWGARFGTVDSVAAWAAYLAAYPELFPGGKVAYRAYPNNVKDLFRTGLVYENSVSVNTGDADRGFSATMSQLDQNSYLDRNTYDRTNASIGGYTTTKIGLNIRGNVAYSRSKQQGGLFGENQSTELTSSQFARSLFLGRSWDVSLPFEDKQGNSVSWVGSQADHPFWAEKYNTSTAFEERFVGGIRLNYSIFNWLQADYNLGTNIVNLDRTEIIEVSSRGSLGKMRNTQYRKQEIESNLIFSIQPKLNNDFSVRSSLGTSWNQRTVNSTSASGGRSDGGGFIVRGLHTLQNFLPVDRSIAQGYSRRRLLGLFGDVTLGYKDYAFVTVTGRNDVSSTLPQNNRSYFYPGISGSFIFSDALGLKSNIFNYGKIRAGYAKVGKDADPYNIANTYVLSSSAFLGQAQGYVNFDANGGELLRPEFSKEFEVGTQLMFFNRRINLDLTYYNKNSSSLLASAETPPSSGYNSFYTNFGSIRNSGVEIEFGVNPVRTAVNWNISATFTKNKNIITALEDGMEHMSLGGGFSDITTAFEVGKPYGFLYGSAVYRDSASGELLIDPATGTMILDPTNRMIGDPNPDFKLGINNDLSYKGFQLSVLFDYTKGGDLYSVTNSSLLGRGVTRNSEDRETDWVIRGIYGDAGTGKAILVDGKTIPNQTRITTNDLYFSPTNGNTFAINTANEWNIYDATVYRLREISLGYELPKTLFAKSKISSIVVSLTGRNLWYYAPNFPRYANFDPEAGSYGASNIQGLEFSAAPTSKRYGFNLKVNF